MGTFIKKNKFICLLIVLLAGISLYYIYDSNTGKLPGKKSGGEDVVYSVGGEDITAGQFYDQMYETGGDALIAELFGRTVTGIAVETTDEIRAWAQNQAAVIIQNYKYSYGAAYEDVIGQALIESGYTGFADLEQYLIDYRKEVILTAQYAKEHFDDLKIRNVSYLLLQESDDIEQRKSEVDAALASGIGFAETAKTFSDDTSTSYTGGVLGVIDANSGNLDEAFLDAALALAEGETSGWVHSETFGWFRIRNNASTPDKLEEVAIQQALEKAGLTEEDRDLVTADPYEDLVSSYDTTLTGYAIMRKAEELGVDFNGDEALEDMIYQYYAVIRD